MSELDALRSAVTRAVAAIRSLIAKCAAHVAEIEALREELAACKAVIVAQTAELEAAIPDEGGSTGGVVG